MSNMQTIDFILIYICLPLAIFEVIRMHRKFTSQFNSKKETTYGLEGMHPENKRLKFKDEKL